MTVPDEPAGDRAHQILAESDKEPCPLPFVYWLSSVFKGGHYAGRVHENTFHSEKTE